MNTIQILSGCGAVEEEYKLKNDRTEEEITAHIVRMLKGDGVVMSTDKGVFGFPKGYFVNKLIKAV